MQQVLTLTRFRAEVGLWVSLVCLLALDYLALPALNLSDVWVSRLGLSLDLSMLLVLGLLLGILLWQGVGKVQSALAVTGHVVRARLGWSASRAPDGYIRELFDGYAEQFDDHLVKGLGYDVPEHLLQILKTHLDLNRRWAVLDLGCGTGLCGEQIAPLASRLVGLDLSRQMLREAEQRKVYDELVCDSIERVGRHFDAEFECVLAADVFCYTGSLQAIFQAIKQVLKPGGYFAFSVERSEKAPWVLNRTGRFAHSTSYIQWLAHCQGFDLVHVQPQVLRTERDLPVHGDLYLFKLGSAKKVAS